MGKRSREVDSASENISDECRSEANCSEDYTPSSSESDGESGSASKRLKKLEAENAALKKKLSQSSADKGGKKKMQRGAPAEEEQQSNPAAVQAIVDKMRISIAKQIEVIMVYKKSMRRGGGGGRISVQVPNLTSQQMNALLGSAVATASNGPKQMVAKVSNDQLFDILGKNVYKSLRYGAILSPRQGLKFTFSKGDGLLTISGTYGME
ncbi:hypothetical protein DUNSADRAFT_3802 [Dunaliella salina]|uniref:Uncharacterized protein n=1 Tax=Dunaliella salina TaxID=3046 RepID=A0ABQ7GTA0_DUNSA|nr:hypothetical protein DUNSADRAFT_3802 [Dunaliella salina]|eukprot:KAF5837839.1 hypothetical protein DUNSADRAFT_3802 [Dunaliella salina]